MTLSGKSDSRDRRDAARDARIERATAQSERKPWLMPLIVTIAVVVLVGAVIYSFVNGLI